jgi:8-oxo-dGTP pyrophosphatase MutT (NUDIX family)
MEPELFQQFVDQLEKRLQMPLPGRPAQMSMAPKLQKARKTVKEIQPVDPKIGSVLILLYPHEGKIYFPLMQRPMYDGAHGGQVCFPGGKMDPEDTDLKATAIRETFEEIGVEPSSVQVLGELSELYIFVSNFKVLPIVAYTNQKPDFIPDPVEVAKVIEADLEIILDKEKVKRIPMVVRNNIGIISPYFDVDNHVVWGATAMMLSEFSEILKEIILPVTKSDCFIR